MDIFGGDHWEESDDDSNEYFLNETQPNGVNDEFSNMLLRTKHKLYTSIVLSPNIDNENAQDNGLLEDYLNHMNRLYVMTVVCQNGKSNVRNLNEFPEEVRADIQKLVEWLESFFSKNRIPDTIPYTDYIRNQLHVYPLIQNNSFMNNE
jgi:hypothetical protein